MREKVSFRLNARLLADAREVAAALEIPVTQLVEEALKAHLGKDLGGFDPEDVERRLTRLKELANL